MDVDNESFYAEIASLMPPPGEYSLEDLDEIIRSTDSHLDASLDINGFVNSMHQSDFDMNISEENEFDNFHQTTSLQEPPRLSLENEKKPLLNNTRDDFCFSFSAFPSPASSADYSSSYKTPPRTASPSFLDDDNFNPDDFINFLSDDDVKTDNLTNSSISKPSDGHRNTPSPTGSCTSSSGSSTSGVQSDASSDTFMRQNTTSESKDELLEFITFKNEKSSNDFERNRNDFQNLGQQLDNDSVVIKNESDNTSSNLLPITMPVLPVAAVQNLSQVSYLQSAIIPLQTVPLTTVNQMVAMKAPSAIKSDNKTPTKSAIVKPLKFVTAPTNSTNIGSPKVTSPPNSKPKTIYLSSNDFKALMQKMNTNGNKIAGVSGQVPKIIMKTASGKVITANKIKNIECNASNSNKVVTEPPQTISYAPKFVKTSDPIIVTQQQSPKSVLSNAVVAPARASIGQKKLTRNDFALLKNLNDEKVLKKQLRMLKNRESASLSRKKKKEYIERLETRISDLEKENYSIRGENNSLRSQLMAFAQTCNCKHGNVSEFILNTLNMGGQNGGPVLNKIDASSLVKNAKQHLENCKNVDNNNINNSITSATQHVKIAPKPANASPFINKGFKQRMSSATVKKNVAVLFAMAFMVTLNVGNFQSYLNKSAVENAIETGVSEEQVTQTGRRLLWVPNEHELQEQVNRSKRDTDAANMPPPPLHFLRPINRSTSDKMNKNSEKDEPPVKRSSTIYANATLENMRLARNLHKWIGGNDYLNLTGTRTDNDIAQMKHFKFDSESYMDYDLTLQAPIGTKQKRKITFDAPAQGKYGKLNIKSGQSSLDVFKPRINEEYIRLFKGIKRQDDTFYVLSFNMDHILLPASAYNKSSRPKMSLMLPSGDPLENGDVVLMQIDCEVINTTELEIKSNMIPEKLRPTKFSGNVKANPNDIANNETIDSSSAKSTRSNESANNEEPKKKLSVPRTYLMMGPKNHPSLHSSSFIGNSSNVVKRKPAIVKLNANDSVIGSGVLNVRNSSLFSRMRETVSAQGGGILSATDVKKLM